MDRLMTAVMSAALVVVTLLLGVAQWRERMMLFVTRSRCS